MIEGTPFDWNKSNVIRIGIVNRDYTLNETKLDYLYNLSVNNYDDSRSYLASKFDYLIFFTEIVVFDFRITLGFTCALFHDEFILNSHSFIVLFCF